MYDDVVLSVSTDACPRVRTYPMIKNTSVRSSGFLARLSAGVFAAVAAVSLHAQVEGPKSDWVPYESGAYFHYQKQNSNNENLDAKPRIDPNDTIPSGNGASLTYSGGVYTFKLSSNVDRIEYRGRSYSSGVVQLAGEVKVAEGTNGSYFAQLWHAGLLKTEGGKLEYHTAGSLKKSPVPAKDYVIKTNKSIAGRWVKINIIHDASQNYVRIYLDGSSTPVVNARTGDTNEDYYMKYGAYNNDGGDRETIQWRNVKVYKKK
jgi:hypothetical protein